MRALAMLLLVALAACSTVQGSRLYSEGTRALERGDTDRAVDRLERAAELVPEGSEIQNHLGIAYQASGRPDDALVAFERAVELDCDNGAAVANLEALRARLLIEGEIGE